MNAFQFTPANGFRDAVSFPDTPADARDMFQSMLDQMRNYMNNTVAQTIIEHEVLYWMGAV